MCEDEMGGTDFHLMTSCVMWTPQTHLKTWAYKQVQVQNVHLQPGMIIRLGSS